MEKEPNKLQALVDNIKNNPEIEKLTDAFKEMVSILDTRVTGTDPKVNPEEHPNMGPNGECCGGRCGCGPMDGPVNIEPSMKYNPMSIVNDYFGQTPANGSSGLETSEIVRERILRAGKPFHSNHNIAEFIREGELEALVDEVAGKMEGVLRSLVIDIDNDHNTQDTARRVAKMWLKETYAGRYIPAPKITSFPNVGYDDLYISGPISIRSTCAHHFQNIVGRCWVGVFPEEKVIGLSKFNRVVHWISNRPQIQEEMTTQIADELVRFAETPNVAVVVKAEHHCMTMRGVKEHESDMTTAVMRGKFREDASLKDEFYKLMLSMKGHSN